MADKRIGKTLKQSVIEGSFSSAMIGFGESFFGAFGIFLKATNVQLGVLGSIPQLLGALAQLLTTKLLRIFGTRKKLIATFAMLQGIMLIPIMLCFLADTLQVYALIICVSLYWMFGQITSPAWSSWFSDLVDPQERGAYFGMRNRITGITSFFALMLAGLLLQYFKSSSHALYGFIIIFSCAFLMRVVSFVYLLRHHEPAFAHEPDDPFGFVNFVRSGSKTNYGVLVLFLSSMSFGVWISGPFFAAYMLNDLKFSYLTFTLVTGATMIVKFLCMPLWGKATDRYGAHKVLMLTAFLVPVLPVMWMMSTSIYWIVFIQIVSGFFWAGYDLSAFSFLLDATEPAKRSSLLSYYNVVNGIFIFLGAMIGGIIVKNNMVFWTPFFLVFLISGMTRLIVAVVFVPKLHAVRKFEHISYRELLFSVLSIEPTIGAVNRVLVMAPRSLSTIKPIIMRARLIIEPLEKQTLVFVKPIRNAKPLQQPLYLVRKGVDYQRMVIAYALRDFREGILEDPKDLVSNPKKLQRKVLKRMKRIERTAKMPLAVLLPKKGRKPLVPRFKAKRKR